MGGSDPAVLGCGGREGEPGGGWGRGEGCPLRRGGNWKPLGKRLGGLAQRMGGPWLLGGGEHDWGDAAVGEGDTCGYSRALLVSLGGLGRGGRR